MTCHDSTPKDRGARLARATAFLLRHAIKCDEQHQWQMARVCWGQYARAYDELQEHNAVRGLRKNTLERFF